MPVTNLHCDWDFCAPLSCFLFTVSDRGLFQCGYSLVPALFVEETILFPQSGRSYLKSVLLDFHVCSIRLYAIITLCLLLSPHILKLRSLSSLSLCCFSIGYSSPLVISCEFKAQVFHLCIKASAILLGITFNMQIVLGHHIAILTILNLLIHDYGISFHLFSFLISAVFCHFQCTKSFSSLTQFVCFTFSDVTVNDTGLIYLGLHVYSNNVLYLQVQFWT